MNIQSAKYKKKKKKKKKKGKKKKKKKKIATKMATDIGMTMAILVPIHFIIKIKIMKLKLLEVVKGLVH